jgi:anti-sigma B factor antagonist
MATYADIGTMHGSQRQRDDAWRSVVSEARGPNPITEVVVDGDVVCVTLTGDLDVSCAWSLSQGLHEVADTTTGTVVVNMSAVTFIDSTGISVLVAALQQLSVQRRSLVLRHVSTRTRRVLDLAGLIDALGIEADDTPSD